jgi:multiple sugar transport system permease protein
MTTAMATDVNAAARRGSLKKSRRWALIWSYVFLAIFAGFFLLPPIYMFITSLKTSAEISAATNPWWVFNPTLDNYKALLTSKEFLIFFGIRRSSPSAW